MSSSSGCAQTPGLSSSFSMSSSLPCCCHLDLNTTNEVLPWSHTMVWVGRHLKADPAPPPLPQAGTPPPDQAAPRPSQPGLGKAIRSHWYHMLPKLKAASFSFPMTFSPFERLMEKCPEQQFTPQGTGILSPVLLKLQVSLHNLLFATSAFSLL